eukprot:CAMPEP_0115270352 /NCGR_PEP_ID=MMETSP0270-20121206/53526_1 /TAXON_ID=71861 /ORGANISM="Scrippsiella trochoidea, Strain CCMP3099" /LENGTH=448 /DNA_ID=CAMNT_0002686651 /DNA_START=189 /DNA_END=1535 /DNA_ORIENTATION=-
MAGEAREVAVALDDMKFSAAHFVAFKGFREPVHGHNYSVGVRAGGGALQADGYVADFGDLKKVARKACKKLNHCTLLPMRSDVLQIQRSNQSNGSNGQLEVRCEDGSLMSFPEQDCVLLPVVHTTAEEIAEHLWWDILVTQNLSALLLSRGIQWMEVTVSERPGQGANYRAAVARTTSPQARRRALTGVPTPTPCAAFNGGSGMKDGCSGGACSGAACGVAGQQPMASPTSAVADLPASEPSNGYGAAVASELSNEDIAETAFRMLLSTLGVEESSRPELDRTPARAAKAFREMTAGLSVKDPLTVVGKGLFDVEEAHDLVAIRDIPFHSMCEHHLLPFSGTAHVAYLPEGKVLGLSKFPRLLQVYARRLQLQERLTTQFAEALQGLLQPRAVAVALEATHSCMCHRGVGVNASTRTLVLRGPGRDDKALREQLLDGVSFSSTSRARL